MTDSLENNFSNLLQTILRISIYKKYMVESAQPYHANELFLRLLF
jgi:hypothetical protein